MYNNKRDGCVILYIREPQRKRGYIRDRKPHRVSYPIYIININPIYLLKKRKKGVQIICVYEKGNREKLFSFFFC